MVFSLLEGSISSVLKTLKLQEEEEKEAGSFCMRVNHLLVNLLPPATMRLILHITGRQQGALSSLPPGLTGLEGIGTGRESLKR